ncbi:uncharacterized protein LOC120015612 [Tripterygium wilfordii]|uniref:uncharacterized protein LOC120015612 n=1 Tax=Tripterygium wilfordii TaxID=458696 RepID=UPI0018F86463|nr:uncharacterized protein LOC120015612 [Tripterygium wilfordii]
MFSRIRLQIKMEFTFDFVTTSDITQGIITYVRANNPRGYGFRGYDLCTVQKFEKHEHAEMVYKKLIDLFGDLVPETLSPFQVGEDPSWYLAMFPYGIPFDPSDSVDKLYESSSYQNGEGSEILFISESYKAIIRSMLLSIWVSMQTQVRCRIDLNSIYIDRCWAFDHSEPFTKFMKFDIQGEDQQGDEAEVRDKLKKLFEEINKVSGIKGGLTAEFDVFFETFDLDDPMKLFDNILFATKFERVDFIHRLHAFLENSPDIMIYGDDTKDAFGEDGDEQLNHLIDDLSQEWFTGDLRVLIPSKKRTFEVMMKPHEANMRRCIQTISNLYHYAEEKSELDKAQLVEKIHSIFPKHIAALARGSTRLNLRMSFESCEDWIDAFENVRDIHQQTSDPDDNPMGDTRSLPPRAAQSYII